MNVYSNGCDGCGSSIWSTYGWEWQCVELFERFINVEGWYHGIAGAGISGAAELYDAVPSSAFEKHPNGSGYIPVSGDAVIFGGGYGHVAIVNQVYGSHVEVVEQNASPSGRNVLILKGSMIEPSYGHNVIGVLHAKANTKPPGNGPASTRVSTSAPPSPSSGERPLAVGAHESGEQDVFWKGQDRKLWEAFWANGHWNGPLDLGMGALGSSPTVAVRPWGEQDVFWMGTDRNLWEGWWANGRWNGPINLGMGPLGSQPTAATWGDEVDVFWRGTDNNLWEAWYDNGEGVWHGPLKIGDGPLGSAPAAGAHSTGEQDVFWKGTDGNLWEAWYGGGWHGPLNLGMGPLGSAPSVAVRPSGEQDVFWDGTDGNLWEAKWDGSWSGPTKRGMGELGSAPSATAWGNEVDVFWGGTDVNIWEGFDNEGGWYGPYRIGMGPIG